MNKIKDVRITVIGFGKRKVVCALVRFGDIPWLYKVYLNFSLFKYRSKSSQNAMPLEGPHRSVRRILGWNIVLVSLKYCEKGTYRISLCGQFSNYFDI